MGRQFVQTLVCDYCGTKRDFMVTLEPIASEGGWRMREIIEPIEESTNINEWRTRTSVWIPGILASAKRKPTLHLVFCSEDHEASWKSKHGRD